MRFSTRAIHTGQDADPATGATIVPIYQTSTYTQTAVGEHKGFVSGFSSTLDLGLPHPSEQRTLTGDPCSPQILS